MQEIMFAGSTLQAVATGRKIFTPMETPFDQAASTNAEAFDSAQDERSEVASNLEIAALVAQVAT